MEIFSELKERGQKPGLEKLILFLVKANLQQ